MLNIYWVVLWTTVQARISQLRKEPEVGEITTTVIVIAVLALLAITVLGIFGPKLIAKANSIDLG